MPNNPLNDLRRRRCNPAPKNDFQGLCRAKTQFIRTINRELDFCGQLPKNISGVVQHERVERPLRITSQPL